MTDPKPDHRFFENVVVSIDAPVEHDEDTVVLHDLLLDVWVAGTRPAWRRLRQTGEQNGPSASRATAEPAETGHKHRTPSKYSSISETNPPSDCRPIVRLCRRATVSPVRLALSQQPRRDLSNGSRHERQLMSSRVTARPLNRSTSLV